MSLDVITLGLAKSYTDHHGGGGGQVQPDWNQNDVSAPDYVKNRPFYTEDPVETVLAEESSVSFVDQGELYAAAFPTSFNAEFGQTYKIYWDGSVYECVCENYRNTPIIGNQSIMGLGSDTGEPFIIFNDSGLNETGWFLGTTDTSASHTISISGVVAMVTKIDEKYIPEGLPYLSKENPTCTGSFSINRKSGTTVGPYSFAEGWGTTASGDSSHAEGLSTTASGDNSHAEGWGTTASGGRDSHAEGYYTKASSNDQHVQGKFNIEDSSNTYAHIVGNGTSDTSRSNAHTLDWNGVGWFKDSVKVGGVSQDDSAAKTLATTDYVDTTVSTKISGKQDTLIQSGAAVGQIAKITAVDSNGKPTAWQAVDMPSGGGGGSAVELDTTLTQSGKAADAKAVGDALADLKAIADTGGYFTADTVEGALQEIGAELSGINTLIGTGVIA